MLNPGLGLGLAVGLGTGRAAAAPYEQVFVRFDGSSDYIRNPTETAGAWLADSTGFTYSVWAKFKSANLTAAVQTLMNGANNFRLKIFMNTDGRLYFRVYSTTGTQLFLDPMTGVLAVETLYHFLIACNSTTGELYCYVNDVAGVGSWPAMDVAAPQTMGLGGIARYTGFASGYTSVVEPCNVEVTDWWVDDTFIDISVEANRRKFISATGTPVNLGTNGELPTGSAPAIFFGGTQTAADWNAGDNLGTVTNIETVGTVA